ncbi:MAG: hypothetical protein AB1446_10770 [Bacillota bacterium]
MEALARGDYDAAAARFTTRFRTVPEPPCCRISTAFYVAERELEDLAGVLSRL